MSVTEFILAFSAIIIALAVTDLLTSLHKLIRARRRVQWHWLPLAAAVLMLLLILGFWWVSYRWYSGIDKLSPVGFLPDLLNFMILYLMAAAALPDDVPAEGLNLRDYYLQSTAYFWTLVSLSIGLTTVANALRFVEPGSDPLLRIASFSFRTGNLFLLAAAVVLIFSRRVWLHGLILVLMIASLAIVLGRVSVTTSP